jgi:hypothetical protein
VQDCFKYMAWKTFVTDFVNMQTLCCKLIARVVAFVTKLAS